MQLKIYGEDDSQELGNNSYYFAIGDAVTTINSIFFLELHSTYYNGLKWSFYFFISSTIF